MTKQIKLANGTLMPLIGYGTFRVEDSVELMEAVYTAIKVGYRSIDTAQIYGNEKSVGAGINKAIDEGIVSREDLFITTKVWNNGLSYDETIEAFETSLKKLNVNYLDLYLIHWPGNGKYLEPWKALESLYNEGRIKAIGVSNFNVNHLEELMKIGSTKPMVNQVELHPRLKQTDLIKYCKDNGIQIESWSPLMNGELLDHAMITKIAEKHNKTSAQIILRWNVQQGIVTIPKSMTYERIKSNLEIFDFELSNEEMIEIDSLNDNTRIGPDPVSFDFDI
ncbi:MAG: Glyoxal reductase [Shouchella clausii]|jgi:methylglyoxal/glyoxal reductase